MSDELFQCRICFEEEEIPSLLVAPCRCNGTSKYVHIDCLQTWIKTTENADAKKKCMECRTAYKYTTSSLTENVSMYNHHNKHIWKTYIKHCMYACPFSLAFNCIDNYIFKRSPIMVFIYNPQTHIYYWMGSDDFYSVLFYFSNSVFIFNTRFFIIYLYRICRSVHKKKEYLKSMSFNMLFPFIGIVFFFIINKIIMSYDGVSDLMTYNLLYIMVSQMINYLMLKQHRETIQNMNSNIEINILSYIDGVEINIESRNLELIETEITL